MLFAACERVGADVQRLRKRKIPDACFCRHTLERRGVCRRAHHRRDAREHHARPHAEAEQRGDEGSEARHVSEFSRVLEELLKGKSRYSFGPRPRRAPHTECTMITWAFRFTEKYTWYSVFSSSQRRMSRFFL